ncbi:MAG: amino acid permease [Bacteroidetes bacterium]|nr:amino acid permease [Bacteroidota bacterium]
MTQEIAGVVKPQTYPLRVAIALVIANMVGTGVFTSLGYQVGPIPSASAILLLWFTGGIMSVCGALCYAEIATTLKRSGGEYIYLSSIYHPAVGFLGGWISMVVGFAGAVSAVAIAIGEYAHEWLGVSVNLVAVCSILVVTVVHLFGVKIGGMAQNFLTGFKLLLILFFCLAPLVSGYEFSGNSFSLNAGDWSLVFSSGWAVSLVFVVYAYSGWNASAYIAGNLDNPSKNLPRSLVTGTLVVMTIYLSLNGMFLAVAPFSELEGQNDIGNIAAVRLFGDEAGQFFAGIFSFALLSTLSAMTIAGPRVGEAMGSDYVGLKFLSTKNRFQMPWIAIVAQAGWAILLVLISSFKEVIQYISVSLSWFTLLTVVGIFVLRRKQSSSEGFKVPWYPLPPILFVAVTVWMIVYVYLNDPKIIMYSVGTVLVGLMLYFLSDRVKQ